MLAQALAMYDTWRGTWPSATAKLRHCWPRLGRTKSIWGAPARWQKRYALRPAHDAGHWAGVDLTRINGLGVTCVLKVLSEIGPDLSRFATVKHFCSWLGLCPGTKISGGKVLSARPAFDQPGAPSAEDRRNELVAQRSALGAFYRRLCTRMDKPSANTAVAHKLARMVYFMLTRGEDFVDQGQQHYEEQQRQRSVAALKRRAAALGFHLTPTTVPA